MSEASSRRNAVYWAAGAAVAACALCALLLARTASSPDSAPPPQVSIEVLRSRVDAGALPPESSLAQSETLQAAVVLGAPAQVSLVHLNGGHGMEPLVLNVPLAAGRQLLATDAGVVTLPLEGLDGPQKLTAVVAERKISVDEALSAAKGLTPGGVTTAEFRFTVGSAGKP